MDWVIRAGIDEMDFETVHSWLTTTYWSPGVSRDKVERAARHSSLVLGAFEGPTQIGYLRIVSDCTTFAWVCDVFVHESYRGQGLAQALVRRALDDPEHQGLRRWILATKDAHRTYAAMGFEQLNHPDRWMFKGVEVSPN